MAGVPSWYCRPASNSTGPGHSQECSAGVPPGQLACKHGGSGWGVGGGGVGLTSVYWGLVPHLHFEELAGLLGEEGYVLVHVHTCVAQE